MKSYIHNSESSQKRLDQNIRKKHLNLFHLTLLEGLFTNFHIGGSRNRRVSAQRETVAALNDFTVLRSGPIVLLVLLVIHFGPIREPLIRP